MRNVNLVGENTSVNFRRFEMAQSCHRTCSSWLHDGGGSVVYSNLPPMLSFVVVVVVVVVIEMVHQADGSMDKFAPAAQLQTCP